MSALTQQLASIIRSTLSASEQIDSISNTIEEKVAERISNLDVERALKNLLQTEKISLVVNGEILESVIAKRLADGSVQISADTLGGKSYRNYVSNSNIVSIIGDPL